VRVGTEEKLPSQQAQQELPASYETAPDATGMRMSVSFRWAGNGGDRHVEKVCALIALCAFPAGNDTPRRLPVQVTKYIKTVTKTTRVSKAADDRRVSVLLERVHLCVLLE